MLTSFRSSTFRKSVNCAGTFSPFVNCFAAAAVRASSTSHTATMSPNRLALFVSPRPWLPHPMRAMPGRSLGEVTAGTCCDASSSRSTNHRGRPVAAAMAAQSLTNVRREILIVFDTATLNDKRRLSASADGFRDGGSPGSLKRTRISWTGRGSHGSPGRDADFADSYGEIRGSRGSREKRIRAIGVP